MQRFTSSLRTRNWAHEHRSLVAGFRSNANGRSVSFFVRSRSVFLLFSVPARLRAFMVLSISSPDLSWPFLSSSMLVDQEEKTRVRGANTILFTNPRRKSVLFLFLRVCLCVCMYVCSVCVALCVCACLLSYVYARVQYVSCVCVCLRYIRI